MTANENTNTPENTTTGPGVIPTPTPAQEPVESPAPASSTATSTQIPAATSVPIPVAAPAPPASVVTPTSPSTPAPTTASATTPPATPSSAQKPIIRTNVQKRGRKISPKLLAVGCIGFIVLMIWLLMVAGYAGLQNPKALASIGMTPSQAKSLLMIVAWAFFGILFFVSFAFLALNGYRLTKAKNAPKGKFIFGIIIAFIALTLSIGAGAGVLLKIGKINTEEIYSKNLVIGFIGVMKPGDTKQTLEEIAKPWITAIAPAQIYMKINNTFRIAVGAKLGVNDISSAKLDCGTKPTGTSATQKQMVTAVALFPTDGSASTTMYFDTPCMYTQKGVYQLSFEYTYFDKNTQQSKTETMPVGSVEIPAEISLSNEGVKLTTNDAGNEMLAGDSPARIVFDAKKIFTDFGLAENLIIWDLDGDGSEDTGKENKSFFSQNYTEGKLYNISYRLPGNPLYPLYQYSFPLRVLQSDVPTCTIAMAPTDGGKYTFKGTWDNGGVDIANMRFEVYNLSKEQAVQTSPAQTPLFTYAFNDKEQYVVRLLYTTLDKKKWFCESAVINATAATYNIQTSRGWKEVTASTYAPITNTGRVSLVGETITAKTSPFDVQLRIDGISPSLPQAASVSVFLDDTAMESVKANLYIGRIYGPGEHKVRIFIDDMKGNTQEKIRTISFDQAPLLGSVNVDKTTGVDPLLVNFDASTITATQPWDEIIYFTWVYGDGQTAKNVSQAKVSHTYSFSTQSGSGIFKPTVTVTTKKWYTKTFALDTQISVKRQATTVSLAMPSHPTQVASIGEEVTVNMQTDGLVSNITWDFGDESAEVSCEYRSCAEAKHTYSDAGTYTIRVTVEYTGLPSSTNTIKVKVE